MACHRFADAIRARARGAPLHADAAAHLAVCSNCQAALETEERVMATIGAALEELASTAPSPTFVSRVRTQIENAPRRWTPGTWWMPVTVVTLALLIAVVVVSRTPLERSGAREAALSRSVDRPGGAAAEAAADSAVKGARVETTRRSSGVRRRPALEPTRVAQTPEVLVPGQRRLAVGRLFASLRAGRPEAISMLMNLPGREAVGDGWGLTIEPLHIEPVVVSAMPSPAFVIDK